MQKPGSIIRKTESVCPVCVANIEAWVIERDGKIYLDKKCASHGDFSLLLSRHPQYYKGLSEFYFPLMRPNLPQHDYILHLTNKCELNCPICLASANLTKTKNYPLADLKEFLRGKKGYKIDLMGAEPATREDLPQIIRVIRESGNISALHTNGIRIADYNYLESLHKAGLSEVHLQLDGFDDAVYEKIRGEKLLALKEQTLRNLERLNIATDLVVTIVRGVNESQMNKVLNYAAQHSFVKEVFFLGCRFLGKAKELPKEQCMMPDELIDLLEEQTAGKISRGQVFKFQKLYFAALSALCIRKCFYINHFLVKRVNNGYAPIDKVFDLDSIQANLGKFKELRLAKSFLAVPYFFISLALKFMRRNNFPAAKEFLSYAAPLVCGFNLSRLSGKTILLGFISACDVYSMDYEIAKNCGKGAISINLGIQDCGAIDNVMRDKCNRQGV